MMKPATVTSVVIFLLLTVVTVSASGLAVMDVKGRPVKANKPYFIKPAAKPDLWVSRYRRTVDNECPQAAVLLSHPVAVVFLLESGAADDIRLDTNLAIRFNVFDYCPESGIWKVDKNSPFPTPDITATGSGSVFTPDNTFKIQKDNDAYKFVHESNNVGVFTDPKRLIEHLVLNSTSLDVIFVPANYKTSFYSKDVGSF